jgi:V-type H+-transporting ATPase subunit G
MQVGAGADGIKMLIDAEQAAQSVVQGARQEKADKIKQAQREAEKDIGVYKEQREDAYRQLMEQGRGDAAGKLTELEANTKKAIQELEASVAFRKEAVASEIVHWVVNV